MHVLAVKGDIRNGVNRQTIGGKCQQRRLELRRDAHDVERLLDRTGNRDGNRHTGVERIRHVHALDVSSVRAAIYNPVPGERDGIEFAGGVRDAWCTSVLESQRWCYSATVIE